MDPLQYKQKHKHPYLLVMQSTELATGALY